MPLAGLGLGQADLGNLGVSVGDPGHGVVVHLGRQGEERVADDDAGVIAGHVGELIAAGHVADGEDLAVAGAQPPVDDDPARGVVDLRRLQAQAVDVGPAAGGDQQMGALDLPGLAAVLDAESDAVALAGHGFDPDAFPDLDAFGGEAPAARLLISPRVG